MAGATYKTGQEAYRAWHKQAGGSTVLILILKESRNVACSSSGICADRRRCFYRRVRRDGTRSTNPVSQADRAPQSLSPRRGLAQYSPEHEWRPLGRGHPGACRARRQHLGLSSLLQHHSRRPRHLHQSRRRQSADSKIRPFGQAAREFRCGTIRLSAWLHHRSRGKPLGERRQRRSDRARHVGEERRRRDHGPGSPQIESGRQSSDDARQGRRLRKRSGQFRSSDRNRRRAERRYLRQRRPPAQHAHECAHREVRQKREVHQELGT